MRLHRTLFLALMALMGSICSAIAAPQSGICEAQILSAARQWGVPPGILHSVGLTETGRKGALYPYALNIEGRSVFAASKAEALEEFARAKAEGHELIDVGCMQINYHYHGQEFGSVAEMFDPRSNVQYAAEFLSRLHARHETWTMAVARYHAGPDNNPAQKRYICRVISNLVTAGHGAWTDQARVFCR